MPKLLPIEEWSLDRIQPYPDNAKLHPEWQVEAIAASIDEFTFIDPIAVDENGEILEGHGRLQAALIRNLPTVPVLQVLGLTDAQKKAYRLAHNALTTRTGYDPELLQAELDALAEYDFPIESAGFDQEYLDQILNEVVAGDEDEEDFSEPEPSDTGQKLPLSIVLSWKDWQRWKVIKEKLKIKSDTGAFEKSLGILEGGLGIGTSS